MSYKLYIYMKVLLYYDETKLKPVGGPAGYLYNIKQKRDEINDNEISFINNKNHETFKSYILSKFGKINRHLKYITKEEMYIDSIIYSSKHKIDNTFNGYDCVHFHSTFDLYANKKNLEKYDGKVILTSHSPKTSYKEYIEDVISKDIYNKNKSLFDKIEEFDTYSFNRADYIIFPCLGAEDPYFHSWSLYEKIRDKTKIKYVPTGIIPVTCKNSRQEIRKKYNIPNDAILLSFVGRHNEVKGYDILQDIFSQLKNVYVICCGKIGNIKPPKSDRWIEVGWTNDPYSIVQASDIYMLPNRETYFDIAMLQTLSIGKCSVISNTGGNKEFVNTPGVKLFNTINDAINCIKNFIEIPIEKRTQLEKLQQKEFNQKYTIDVFYKQYKQTLNEILKTEAYFDEK